MNLEKFNPDRFFSKTQRDSSTGCLNWTAATLKKGYGAFNIGGRAERAHRVAWVHVKGEIPPGKLVCHTCDNPRCVEITHLFLGTALENTRDMLAKGRWTPWNARLTHCKWGHSLEDAYVYGGQRHCRSCAKAANHTPQRKNYLKRLYSTPAYKEKQRNKDRKRRRVCED